jgi:integrase
LRWIRRLVSARLERRDHRINHLPRLYAERLASGLSPTSVHHIHVTLHGALKQALRWGMIDRNPTKLIDPPRRTHPETTTWRLEDARAVLIVGNENNLAALWRLALSTGMRRGEILGLKSEDIDFQSGMLMMLLGEHPKIVQERLGHSDLSMTLNRDSHVTPGMQRRVADNLSSALNGPTIASSSEKRGKMKPRGANTPWFLRLLYSGAGYRIPGPPCGPVPSNARRCVSMRILARGKSIPCGPVLLRL